ncbi:hypothetical protein L195_g056097, partial [Trifolium pratense]
EHCAWRNSAIQRRRKLCHLRHGAEELRMAKFKNARSKIYLLVAPWRSGLVHGAMQGFSEDAFFLLAAPWRKRAAHGAGCNCLIASWRKGLRMAQVRELIKENKYELF